MFEKISLNTANVTLIVKISSTYSVTWIGSNNQLSHKYLPIMCKYTTN